MTETEMDTKVEEKRVAKVVEIKCSSEYAVGCFRTAETVVLSNGLRLDRWCDETRNFDWVSTGRASQYAPGSLQVGSIVTLNH